MLRSGGTIAAVLGTGSLAGCIEGLGNAGTAGSQPLADVPPTGDAVLTVDANTFFADDGVRNTYDAWLAAQSAAEYYEGPTSLEGALDAFEEQEGVDPRDLSRVVAFFSFDGERAVSSNDGTGYLIEGAWDAAELVDYFDHEYVEYTESTYGDHTIHEPDDEYTATVGVLEEGRYVAGGPTAVRRAIDVDRGEAEPIGGPVADAYSDTTAGPVRFATAVRAEWFPEEYSAADASLDLSPVRSVETATGAIYRDGNTRGIRVALNAPDEAGGEDLVDLLNGLLSLAESQVERQDATPEFVTSLLADVDVTRDGERVTLGVERSVDELEAMAEEFGEYTTGASGVAGESGASDGASSMPAASFDWDHDADARTVTITHTAGDTLEADRLRIDGEGFATVDDADQTAAGPWAGTTSEEGTVRAGNSVVVGAASDCVLRIVWETTDTASTLDAYQGPDA